MRNHRIIKGYVASNANSSAGSAARSNSTARAPLVRTTVSATTTSPISYAICMRNCRIITGNVVCSEVKQHGPGPISSHNCISYRYNNISNILRYLYEKPPYNNRECGLQRGQTAAVDCHHSFVSFIRSTQPFSIQTAWCKLPERQWEQVSSVCHTCSEVKQQRWIVPGRVAFVVVAVWCASRLVDGLHRACVTVHTVKGVLSLSLSLSLSPPSLRRPRLHQQRNSSSLLFTKARPARVHNRGAHADSYAANPNKLTNGV